MKWEGAGERSNGYGEGGAPPNKNFVYVACHFLVLVLTSADICVAWWRIVDGSCGAVEVLWSGRIANDDDMALVDCRLLNANRISCVRLDTFIDLGSLNLL